MMPIIFVNSLSQKITSCINCSLIKVDQTKSRNAIGFKFCRFTMRNLIRDSQKKAVNWRILSNQFSNILGLCRADLVFRNLHGGRVVGTAVSLVLNGAHGRSTLSWTRKKRMLDYHPNESIVLWNILLLLHFAESDFSLIDQLMNRVWGNWETLFVAFWIKCWNRSIFIIVF